MDQVDVRRFDLALNQVATVASLSFGRRDLSALHTGIVLQTLDALSSPSSPEQVTESIRERLGIRIEIGAVVDAIGALFDTGQLVQLEDFRVCLDDDARSALRQQKSKADVQRRAVTTDWLDSVDSALVGRGDEPLSPLQRVQLEGDLDVFLAQLLRYHGAEVAYFLYPSNEGVEAILALDDAVLYSKLPPSDDLLTQLRREFLPRFVREATGSRALYIADRLHRAFLLQVLQVDASASALFAATIEPKDLFLDTNFVFRAMGMQGNVLKGSTREAISLSQSLGHALRITGRTLSELEHVVKQQSEWLARGPEVPESLAGIASEHVAKNDYVSSYWKDRERSGITAAQFRERFSNIQLQLENLGISIFPVDPSDAPDPATVEAESGALRPFKPTADPRVVEHDAYHKVFIEQRRIRRMEREPFGWYEASDLFLTFDNSLPTFAVAETKAGRGQRVPFCLMANEWLQLLYFIKPEVQMAPDVFVNLINSPYLESYFSATAMNRDTVRRVVCTMAEIGEYRPEVARKLMVDRLLRKRLEAAQDTEQTDIIRDAVRVSSRIEDERLTKLLAEKERRIRELEDSAATGKGERRGPDTAAFRVSQAQGRGPASKKTTAMQAQIDALRAQVGDAAQLRRDVETLRADVKEVAGSAVMAKRWLLLFPLALVFFGINDLLHGATSRWIGSFEVAIGVSPILIGWWKRFTGRAWELLYRVVAVLTLLTIVWDHYPKLRSLVSTAWSFAVRLVQRT